MVKPCEIPLAGCAFGTFVAPVLADRIGGLALANPLRLCTMAVEWHHEAIESCTEKDVHRGSIVTSYGRIMIWNEKKQLGTGSSKLDCLS